MNTRLPALLASVANSTRRTLLPGRRPASLSAAAQRAALHTGPKQQQQQQESRLVGLLEPYWDAAMGVHISSIVAGLAGIVGASAWGLRHVLPLPVSVVLWHVAGTGMLVAAAATETMAGRTTGLLGKVGTRCGSAGKVLGSGAVSFCMAVLPWHGVPPKPHPWPTAACHASPPSPQSADGTISPLSFSLLWPYHAGLRAKLALQRRVSTEPAFSQVGLPFEPLSTRERPEALCCCHAWSLLASKLVRCGSIASLPAGMGLEDGWASAHQRSEAALAAQLPSHSVPLLLDRRSPMTTTLAPGPASRSWCPR